MESQNLLGILVSAAKQVNQNGIHVHRPSSNVYQYLTYKFLLSQAERRSKQLERLGSINDKVILMYFTDHLDSIVWFWSIVAAGAIPCICPPLVKDLEQRQKNAAHLQELLGNPFVITTGKLASEFPKRNGLRIVTTGKSSSSLSRIRALITLLRSFLRVGDSASKR
jgi:acyl-CoA synthetase (AMP-forming)/AMP-acid ligase II